MVYYKSVSAIAGGGKTAVLLNTFSKGLARCSGSNWVFFPDPNWLCAPGANTVSEWCRQRGVTTATYYRWERELLTGVRKNGAPPSTAVTFAELPAPKQVSCNVAERCATLHIGKASLDIYPGCNAEQLRLLVELLRLC